MELEIKEIQNAKLHREEKVSIVVKSNTNLSGYAIIDKQYFNDNGASNTFGNIYLFPSMNVKAGDKICLCSGNGTNKPMNSENKKGTTYMFYWNSDVCIWNNEGDKAYLIKIEKKQSKDVPAIEEG